ncbi:hypothetical protein INR49_021765 [Caranx melampygus]|nr:hypothetical protein INR49_021765 [Caranx melampygus]
MAEGVQEKVSGSQHGSQGSPAHSPSTRRNPRSPLARNSSSALEGGVDQKTWAGSQTPRPIYSTSAYVTNMRLFAGTSPESSTGEGHKSISMNLERLLFNPGQGRADSSVRHRPVSIVNLLVKCQDCPEAAMDVADS